MKVFKQLLGRRILQHDATTEYYGEFGADTEVVGNTVTPTKGARAGDGEVTILDATMIQRWLVNLSAADGIGKPIG